MPGMRSHRDQAGRPGCHRACFPVLLTALLLGAPVHGQSAPRLWAAQTGPDQVMLSWDPVAGAGGYRIHVGDPDAAGSLAISSLGGSSRGGVLPLRRVTADLWLVVVDGDGRATGKAPFNAITPVRGIRPVAAPAAATATITGPDEVTLSWEPVPGATAYMIGRAVSPGGLKTLCNLCSTNTTYVDRDITPGADHSYTVAAIYPGGISPRTRSNRVTPGAVSAAQGSPGRSTPLPTLPTTTAQTTPPTSSNPTGPATTPAGPLTTPTGPATTPAGPATTPTGPATTPPGQPAGTPGTLPPATKTPLPTGPGGKTPPPVITPGPCRLDYQRADNMWAALGRPDGALGVETITVPLGQTRVFVTDWRYEKTRNDGTNYYGSHLRVATNAGARPVKVKVRSIFTDVKHLFILMKGGTNEYFIRVDPLQTSKFSADLMEVSCT